MNRNLKRAIEEKEKFNKQLKKRIKQMFGAKCKDYNKDCVCCNAWEIFEELKYDFEEMD